MKSSRKGAESKLNATDKKPLPRMQMPTGVRKPRSENTKHKLNNPEKESSPGIEATTAVQKPLSEAESRAQKVNEILQSVGFQDQRVAAVIVEQSDKLQASWSFGERQDVLTLFTMMREMKPETVTQALLALQMVAVHQAALASLCKAGPYVPAEGPDIHMDRAIRLFRLFVELTSAMAKQKDSSIKQQMIVKHIHISEGGQAIVGPINTRQLKQGKSSADKNEKKTP